MGKPSLAERAARLGLPSESGAASAPAIEPTEESAENAKFDADDNSAKEPPVEKPEAKPEKSELETLREERDDLRKKIEAIYEEIKEAERGILTARDRFSFLQGSRRSNLGRISTLEIQLSNTEHRIAMREREKPNA